MRRWSSWPIPCQAASSYADSAGQELLSMLRPHADAASTSWEAAQHPSLDDELLRQMSSEEPPRQVARAALLQVELQILMQVAYAARMRQKRRPRRAMKIAAGYRGELG